MPVLTFEDFKFLSSSGEQLKASVITLRYERKVNTKKPYITGGGGGDLIIFRVI
jgi:hypothetical protein